MGEDQGKKIASKPLRGQAGSGATASWRRIRQSKGPATDAWLPSDPKESTGLKRWCFSLRLKTSGCSTDRAIYVERKVRCMHPVGPTCEQPHRFFDRARLSLSMIFLSSSDLLKPATCIRREEIMLSLALALPPHTA